MKISRRSFIAAALSLLAWPALADRGFHRHPHGEKKKRLRRARVGKRQIQTHRIRRAVRWDTLRGRRVLVIPKALAPGWELNVDDEVVLVKYVHASRIVVEHKDGSEHILDVLKKNTESNTKELEGTKYSETVVEGVE